LGLGIPRDIARELGIKEGTEVEVGLEGKTMTVKTRSGLEISVPKRPFKLRPREELVALEAGGKGVVQIIREMRD